MSEPNTLKKGGDCGESVVLKKEDGVVEVGIKDENRTKYIDKKSIL